MLTGMTSVKKPRSLEDYTVGCIYALGTELAAVEGMLDVIHDPLPTRSNTNAYTLGQLGEHYIVLAVMPEVGTSPAATVAARMMNDFPSIKFGLLVGIGGGVPGKVDVRLGDVVVSQATGTIGGVVQFDFDKRLEGGKFQRMGALSKPPSVLSTNVHRLESQHRRVGHKLSYLVSEMTQRYPLMRAECSRLALDDDFLFLSSYSHQSSSANDQCDRCDRQYTVNRPSRMSDEPYIHYGTIGSSNVVVKDATIRDELKKDLDILCVEMEAAGLMDSFPCLVIRGISDYADSHKNEKWQSYAAAVAAAYMKELLLIIPAQQVVQTEDATQRVTSPSRLGLHLEGAPIIDSCLFAGRCEELKIMEQILQLGSRSEPQRRVVLKGMEGIGKTQLAITYAIRNAESYDSIFWLNAASDVVLKQSLRRMAERTLSINGPLDDDQLVLHVRRWLSDASNSRWLLIFDDYNESGMLHIDTCLPNVSHGSVIITTRYSDQIVGKQVSVHTLQDIEDSLWILTSRSQREDGMGDDHARHLAGSLVGFPLALVTAGAHLRKSRWTFERYLKECEKKLQSDPHYALELPEYPNRVLYATLELSYALLQHHEPQAARLLKFLAYFDCQTLSYELLGALTSDYQAQNSFETKRTGHGSSHEEANDQIYPWLREIMASPSRFDSTMRILVEYCFVETAVTTHTYSMPSCVHDWTLVGVNNITDPRRYWYAFNCVAKRISGIQLHSQAHVQYAWLVPHAIRLTHKRFHELLKQGSINQLCGLNQVAQLIERYGHKFQLS